MLPLARTAACHETAQLPLTRERARSDATQGLRDLPVPFPHLHVRSHAEPTATCPLRMRPVDSLSNKLADFIIEPLSRWPCA